MTNGVTFNSKKLTQQIEKLASMSKSTDTDLKEFKFELFKLKDLITEVHQDLRMDNTDKIDILLEIYPIINHVFNDFQIYLKPDKSKHIFHLIYLNIDMIRSYILLTMVQGITTTSANRYPVIANLLESVLQKQEENITYYESLLKKNFKVYFPTVLEFYQANFGIFAGLVGLIDDFHIDDLKTWIKNAYRNYYFQLRIIQKFELQNWEKYEFKNYSREIPEILNLIFWPGLLLVELIQHMYQYLGPKTKILTQALEPVHKGMSVHELLNIVSTEFSRLIKEGKQLVSSNNAKIQIGDIRFEKIEIVKSTVENFISFHDVLTQNKKISTLIVARYQSFNQQLTILINKIEQHYKQTVEGKNTQIGKIYFTNLKRIVFLDAIVNYYNGETADNYLEHKETNLANIQQPEYVDYYLLIFVSRLCYYFENFDKKMITQAIERLWTAVDKFDITIRDQTCFSILLSLSEYQLKIRSKKELIQFLNDLPINYPDLKTQPKLEKYVNSLLLQLENNQKDLIEFSKNRINEWDWRSFLVPNFDNSPRDEEIKYIPFNRWEDHISDY